MSLILRTLPPLRLRSPFLTSRIAILSDGSSRPMLILLAEKKFGFIPRGLFPFWLDGNPLNESTENIGLATRPPKQVRDGRGAPPFDWTGYYRRSAMRKKVQKIVERVLL